MIGTKEDEIKEALRQVIDLGNDLGEIFGKLFFIQAVFNGVF